MFPLKPIAALGKFWQDKTLSLIFRWTIFFIVLELGLLIWKYKLLPPYVPMFFSLPWGESRLAPVNNLFFFPAFSVIILLLNNLLAVLCLSNAKLVSYLLSLFSAITAFFLMISLYHIIFLIS